MHHQEKFPNDAVAYHFVGSSSGSTGEESTCTDTTKTNTQSLKEREANKEKAEGARKIKQNLISLR